jgi:flagellar motor switch protein FliG
MMGAEKTIVLTTFGQGETVERISVSVFDVESDSWGRSNGASNYCRTINKLHLKNDDWVFARIVDEYAEYTLENLLPDRSRFAEIIPQLDDRAIQKILLGVDSSDRAIALKGANSEVQNKLFRNFSKKAAEMLKEDMEFMGPVRMSDMKEQQEKIVDIIQNLEAREKS